MLKTCAKYLLFPVSLAIRWIEFALVTKIPSEMEVAPRYTLLTLLTLFTLVTLFILFILFVLFKLRMHF